MRTQTDTYSVYTFKELAENVQARLIEDRQQANGEYFDAADWIYDDVATIADLFGLDIRTRTVQLHGGGTRQDPCIYYSGFSSQGDGACFEGNYNYKPGALKAVMQHAPQDTELHQIVKDLQNIQARNFYQLTASTTHRGHYYHSGCMNVTVDRQDDREPTDSAEEDITQALRDFADWIYSQLENAYDWDTSDENARDYLENDDTEYTAAGEPI